MNLDQGIQFVRSRGDNIEQARLKYILANEQPSQEVVASFFAGQRADGGWPPFWAQDYSSLDATCFRLAQAEQLGLSDTEPDIQQAMGFLAERQSPQGSWEEDSRVAGLTPSWARPGDFSAMLYLTANCGLWLAHFEGDPERASKAAAFLKNHLNESGRLPGFMHTHWLAGGLWKKLDWQEPAEHAFDYLSLNLAGLAASELAWLLTTLYVAGVMPDHPLAKNAASLLVSMQHDDGRWSSEDGPEYDVHTTLESMRALLYG